MPPGMKIERIFDVTTVWGDDDPPVRRYDVEVTYSDRHGKAQDPLRYPIDFDPYLSGTFTVRKSWHDGVKALLAMKDSIEKWSEGKQGVAVWARDGDARDSERRRLRAERIATRETTRAASSDSDD